MVRTWAFGVLASLTGCIGGGAFPCDNDRQCTEEFGGVCIDESCAYPDDMCPSEFSFGSAAGSKAGMCVEPTTPATTSSTTATGSLLTLPGSSSGTPSTSTMGDPPDMGPDPLCGDGKVDPGEDCDEGEPVDGPNCNRNCGLPLQRLWTQTWSGRGTRARALAIAVDGERLAVGGRQAFGDPLKDESVLCVIGTGGELQWCDYEREEFAAGRSEVASLARTATSGEVLMAGTVDLRAFVARYSIDTATPPPVEGPFGDARVQWLAPDGMGGFAFAGATAVAADGDGAIVVGSSGGGPESRRPFIARVRLESPPTEPEVVNLPYDGMGGDEPLSVVLDDAGVAYVVGHRGNNSDTSNDDPKLFLAGSYAFDGAGWVDTPVGFGWVAGEPLATGSWPAAIVIDSSDPFSLVVAGTVDSVAYGRDVQLQRFDSLWAARWDDPVIARGSEAFDDVAHGLTVDDAGNLIAVGSFSSVDGLDIWIGKYGPDGTEFASERINESPESGDDVALCVATDVEGNVYVAGYMTNSATETDTSIWVAAFTP